MEIQRRFSGDRLLCYKNGEREQSKQEYERNTPVRKLHTSTANLLTSSEVPPPDSPSSASRSAVRSHQPSDGISKVVVGGQVTDEEVESLNRRR
ncbi:unnamed protein product [Arabis nemorensis]|uniref:DUF4057 domain-containing protein n=1 Tax=Arabis nemorensis TaxID=586526 RepID=A0A565C572_9BRAS|nr:unnamed protein product [Arabis nemorensis]